MNAHEAMEAINRDWVVWARLPETRQWAPALLVSHIGSGDEGGIGQLVFLRDLHTVAVEDVMLNRPSALGGGLLGWLMGVAG